MWMKNGEEKIRSGLYICDIGKDKTILLNYDEANNIWYSAINCIPYSNEEVLYYTPMLDPVLKVEHTIKTRFDVFKEKYPNCDMPNIYGICKKVFDKTQKCSNVDCYKCREEYWNTSV